MSPNLILISKSPTLTLAPGLFVGRCCGTSLSRPMVYFFRFRFRVDTQMPGEKRCAFIGPRRHSAWGTVLVRFSVLLGLWDLVAGSACSPWKAAPWLQISGLTSWIFGLSHSIGESSVLAGTERLILIIVNLSEPWFLERRFRPHFPSSWRKLPPRFLLPNIWQKVPAAIWTSSSAMLAGQGFRMLCRRFLCQDLNSSVNVACVLS